MLRDRVGCVPPKLYLESHEQKCVSETYLAALGPSEPGLCLLSDDYRMLLLYTGNYTECRKLLLRPGRFDFERHSENLDFRVRLTRLSEARRMHDCLALQHIRLTASTRQPEK